MNFIIAFVMVILATPVLSHEMTPTYPELRPSISEGLYSTELILFNRREDAKFYEIDVFDDNWRKIAFATQNKILKVDYLSKARFEIYVRESDIKKVTYICTTSKLLKDDFKYTGISSKICSKIKRDEK